MISILVIIITIDIMNTFKNQSYFKLPLIVTICSWIILKLQSIIYFPIHNIKPDSLIDLNNFINHPDFDHFLDVYKFYIFYYVLTSGPLFTYFTIFILTLFCCKKYCIHDVSKNWKSIILLSFVFSLLRWQSWRIVSTILKQIRFTFSDNLYLYHFLYFCSDFLITLGILLILFYFFCQNKIFYCSRYEFNTRAYIKLFALFLLYIPLQIFLLMNGDLYNQLLGSIASYLNIYFP